jgi:hypothetical protein
MLIEILAIISPHHKIRAFSNLNYYADTEADIDCCQIELETHC